ncbi:MAG: Arc family DNA-binding protein [Nitrospirae bacterium]|nr:Arc family DNA-binding protein [Candidatus Manganitrophaceae bacterium]
MPTLTLKNIPDFLYLQLKEAAQAHRRSMNSEILYCVEQTLGTHKIDIPEYLEFARDLREKTIHHPLTDKLINDAKNEGRP